MYEPLSGYAGFWKRFAAAFIDGFLIAMATVFVSTVLTSAGPTNVPNFVINIVITWVYSALMESSTKQATLGKLALNIMVMDTNGGRLSFARATGRHFAKIISAFTLGIGFIMAGFTKRKQALHDMIAECVVVNSK